MRLVIPVKAGTYPHRRAPPSDTRPLRPPALSPYDRAMTNPNGMRANRRRHAAAMSQIVSICLIPVAFAAISPQKVARPWGPAGVKRREVRQTTQKTFAHPRAPSAAPVPAASGHRGGDSVREGSVALRRNRAGIQQDAVVRDAGGAKGACHAGAGGQGWRPLRRTRPRRRILLLSFPYRRERRSVMPNVALRGVPEPVANSR